MGRDGKAGRTGVSRNSDIVGSIGIFIDGNGEKPIKIHMCLLSEQKLTASLRILAYGEIVGRVDEIARMGKSIFLESLVKFYEAIKTLYMRDYLSKPAARNLQRLLQKAEAREGYRKDVDKCFGILQACWPIVGGTARIFDKEVFQSIMMMCIILHNMIVEDENDYDE
ncbi:unnamed protein product [Prunus brigantina]